jgi:ankyrin repeat protein
MIFPENHKGPRMQFIRRFIQNKIRTIANNYLFSALKAKSRNTRWLKLLFWFGADINMSITGERTNDERKTTFLLQAVTQQPCDNATAKFLIDLGADPTIANLQGSSPLSVAVDNNDMALISLFADTKKIKKLALKQNETFMRVLNTLITKQNEEAVQKLLALNPKAINNQNPHTNNTRLHIAIDTGSLRDAVFILKVGAELDLTLLNKQGYAAIHYAVIKGQKFKDVVLTMLRKNPTLIDLKTRQIGDREPITVFDLAVSSANMELLRAIEEICPGRLNLVQDGQTALQRLVMQECGPDAGGPEAIKSIQALLQAGASINTATATVAHAAVAVMCSKPYAHHEPTVITALLDHDPRLLRAKDAEGNTLLHLLALSEHNWTTYINDLTKNERLALLEKNNANQTVVRILYDKYKKVDGLSDVMFDGKSLLQHAIISKDIVAVADLIAANVITDLLSDFNDRNRMHGIEQCGLCLESAVSNFPESLDVILPALKEFLRSEDGKIKLLELIEVSLERKSAQSLRLIKKHLGTNALDKLGILYELARSSSPSAVEKIELLLTVMSVDVGNDSGNTPLHVAVVQGSTQVVALLLKNNADTMKQDREGRNSFHYCADLIDKDQAQAKMQMLHDKFLQLGAISDIFSAPDRNGVTPYELVIRNGNGEMEDFMRAKGAQFSPAPSRKESTTAIQRFVLAMKYSGYYTNDQFELGVSKFIALGVDLNHADTHGKTALDYADENQFTAVAKILRDKGAKNGSNPVVVTELAALRPLALQTLYGHARAKAVNCWRELRCSVAVAAPIAVATAAVVAQSWSNTYKLP